MKRFTLLSLICLVLCAAFVGCRKKGGDAYTEANVNESQTVTPDGAEAGKVNPITGMAKMTASSVAFTLGDMSVTWGEFQDYFNTTPIIANVAMGQTPAEFLFNGLEEGQQKAVKQLLKGLVRQLVFANEAKLQKLEISEEEKQAFAERWAKSHPGKTIDKYLERIPEVSTNRLKLNRSEMFMLLKYLDAQLNEVEVPADVLQTTLKRVTQMRSAFEAEMAQRRKDFEELATNPDLNTNEGFARLAREVSDGVESDNGGVIDGFMTRKEIAECNFGQTFTTELGSTSPMIETPTSLRFIRVLEVIPPERAGEEEQLKVAQILFTKRELEGFPTEAEVVQKLKYNYQETSLSQKLIGLLDKYQFTCPLFPNLRDEWPISTEKTQTDCQQE